MPKLISLKEQESGRRAVDGDSSQLMSLVVKFHPKNSELVRGDAELVMTICSSSVSISSTLVENN